MRRLFRGSLLAGAVVMLGGLVGAVFNGHGSTPNLHDVPTASQPNGRFIAGDATTRCAHWERGDKGSAMVGQHDRTSLDCFAAD